MCLKRFSSHRNEAVKWGLEVYGKSKPNIFQHEPEDDTSSRAIEFDLRMVYVCNSLRCLVYVWYMFGICLVYVWYIVCFFVWYMFVIHLDETMKHDLKVSWVVRIYPGFFVDILFPLVPLVSTQHRYR